MNPKIGRVARAILLATLSAGPANDEAAGHCKDYIEEHWPKYIRHAEAALAAAKHRYKDHRP